MLRLITKLMEMMRRLANVIQAVQRHSN